MPSIITVLAPGFEEVEAVTPIDLLRRAGVTVTALGLDSREVTGAHGITITADRLFSEFSGAFDGIVLPGGQPGTKNLADSAPLLDLLRATHKRGGLCAAICAAPIVLAKAGILAGRRATCYPGCEKELVGAEFTEQEIVRDRNIITSRGPGTAVQFALELIAYMMNPETAKMVGKAIVYK
ncbi:MAG: DJ-1/PfpI family protein [Chitinispirillaceae bacterium]|nr:DJ-1/PfpI family protein [Chitinispirillaceae bacterium]